MTTIANYNVSLSMDANSYIDSTKLSRKETSSLTRAINSTRTPAERYERSVSMLDNALKKGAISQRTYNNLLEKQQAKLEKVSKTAQKASGAFSKLAAAVAAVGVGRFVKSSIQLSIEAEQAAASFEVLTGSVNNATVLLSKLRNLASKSPITFAGAQDAAKTLLGFGVEVEQIMPSLEMLSAASMGNEDRFKSLSLAFAQVQAAGKLTGNDLLQMINAGFNPLQEIAAMTGKTIGQLKEEMSDGAVSADMVTEALRRSTGAGGRFDGMMERLANTTGGKLAIAQSQLQQAMIQVGEAMGPLVLTLVDGFEDGNSAIQAVIWSVEKLSDGLSGMIALLRDTASITREFYFAFADFDFSGFMDASEFKAVNSFLDRLDKRDRERANKKDDSTAEFDVSEKQEKRQNTILAAIEDAGNRLTPIWDILKDTSEKMAKDQEDSAKKRLELGQEALANAKAHFAEERKRAEQRRKEIVSQMGGAGQEAGSADAAKFLAQQQNARLAQAEPLPSEPTQRQIFDETKRQLAILKADAEESRKQTEILKQLVGVVEETKVRRIR